jgi:chromosomal replication initiator protein
MPLFRPLLANDALAAAYEPASLFALFPRFQNFADGPDVIDNPSEIPLPGRAFAPTDSGSPTRASLGFIVGVENRLVASTVYRLMHSAANGRVESPDSPLVSNLFALFGSSGTGKTHLALGLVRYWNEHRGPESALYLTAGDFYRQYIDALKRSAIADFRCKLRERELLAIDELHQLPRNEYLLQELRSTLDAFDESGGAVVVASRRAPNTLANLSPDLRSRFSSGLMLQLAPPGSAARIRIIHRAAEMLGHPLSEASAAQMAKSVNGTASELFGALFEYCASTTHSDNGEADAETLSASRFGQQPRLHEILAAAARYFRISQAQIKSSSRRQSIVIARALAIYLARELTDASYKQIGRALGGRDHTTIMHNYRKIERIRASDLVIQEAIEELGRDLRNR